MSRHSRAAYGAAAFGLVFGARAVLAGGGSPEFKPVESAQGSTYLRAVCGFEGFRPCSEALPELKRRVFGTVKNHLDAAYDGKHLDPFPKDGASPYLPGTLMQTPICNPADRVYAKGAELKRNHKDQSCGQVCGFACSQSSPGGAVSCKLDESKAACLSERAWTRGALIQLAWASYDEVAKELGGSKLKLSPRCEAVVTDPKVAKLFDAIAAEVRYYQEVNAGRSPACAKKAGDASADIAGCHLSSSRESLETVVGELAFCETFARAEDRFPIESAYLDRIPGDLAKEAAASPECKGARADAAKFQACINRYYADRIQGRFLAQMGTFKNAPTERDGADAK